LFAKDISPAESDGSFYRFK